MRVRIGCSPRQRANRPLLHAACPLHHAAGTVAAADLALSGDLGASIAAFKDAYPLLVFPAKAVVAFPLVSRPPGLHW